MKLSDILFSHAKGGRLNQMGIATLKASYARYDEEAAALGRA